MLLNLNLRKKKMVFIGRERRRSKMWRLMKFQRNKLLSLKTRQLLRLGWRLVDSDDDTTRRQKYINILIF